MSRYKKERKEWNTGWLCQCKVVHWNSVEKCSYCGDKNLKKKDKPEDIDPAQIAIPF